MVTIIFFMFIYKGENTCNYGITLYTHVILYQRLRKTYTTNIQTGFSYCLTGDLTDITDIKILKSYVAFHEMITINF